MIDASIPLQAQAPQNPLEQYGRVLALKNALGQQQLQQQQIQQGQQQITAQKALDQAFQQGFTKGPDGQLTLNKDAVVNGLTQRGVGHLVPGVLENFNKMDEAAAKLKKTQIEAKTAADDYAANGLLAIADAKFDPSIAIGTIAHARETGAMPPDQALQIAEKITQSPTPETVQALIEPLLSKSPAYQKLVDSRKTAQGSADRGDAAKRDADVKAKEFAINEPGLEINAAQKQRSDLAAKLGAATNPAEYQKILGAAPFQVAREFEGKTPEQARQLGMTAGQQTQAAQAKTNAANTEADRKITQQQGAQRIAISGAELNLKQQENDRKYGELTPDQKVIAGKLSKGDYDPAQLGRLPGPDKEKIMAAAILQAAGEGRDWTPQIYAAKKDFTDPKGKQAQNLGTIARIVGHLGRFEENSKSAGFSPLYGAGTNLTGAAKVLAEDSHAIAGEFEKLVSGGVGTAEQTREWQSDLRSPIPAVRQKAVDEISHLAGSQFEGMNQAYKNGTGDDLPIQKLLSPATQNWLKTKGINVKGAASDVSPIALKDGTTLTPHDATSAAKFRKEHPELLK